MSITWQYVAGFFDGEGSIYVDRRYTRLSMSNTNLEVLTAIKAFLGQGFICSPNRRNWKPTWKVVHQLTIYKQAEVRRILQAMLPYLIVKRERAITTLALPLPPL